MDYNPENHGAICSACPLNGQVKVPPNGATKPKLVIVLDQPGFHDVKTRRLAAGPAGVMLNDLLYHAGMRRDETWVTSALLCRTQVPGETGAKQYDPKVYMAWLRKENFRRRQAGEPELANPVECCQMRLYAELFHFEKQARDAGQPNGAVIVTMGPVALKAVADKDGVLTWRGSPLSLEHLDQNPENT